MPPPDLALEIAFPLDTGGHPLRVVICGGREFHDRVLVHEALERAHARHAIGTIIHSGADGAQVLAAAWAESRGVEVEQVDAAALFAGEPDACIAFQVGAPGCQAAAAPAGVPIWEPYPWKERVVVPRVRRRRRG